MKKTTRLFTSMLVPLAVAGTCLATPAFALPAGLSGFGAQADAVVEEVLDAAPEAEGMNLVSAAGISIELPSDYTVEDSDDGVACTNAAGTASISIFDMRDTEIPDGADPEQFFGQIVAEVDTAGNAEFAGVESLGEGVDAYGFNMSDGDVNFLEVFIPVPAGGFALLEIGFMPGEISDTDMDSIGEALQTVSLAGAAAIAPAEEPGMVMVGNVAMFGGLSITLPDGYTAEVSDDNVYAMYSNEAGTAILSIFDMTALPLDDTMDLVALFDGASSASIADYEDATIESLGTEELGGGLVGYGYGVVIPDGDSQYIMIQVYIPMPEGGFDLLQLGYDASMVSQDEVDELASCLDTVVPAADVAITDVESLASLADGDLGFTFTLPAGFSELEENTWISDNADCIVMGMGDIAVAGISMDDIMSGLADEFDAEVVGTASVDAVNVTVDYALLSAADGDDEAYVVVAMVPVANDGLSMLTIICSVEASETYDAALSEMLSSITVG